MKLDSYLPYRLAAASNRVSRMVARAYHARSGLTIWEWRVIAVLGEGVPRTAQELSEAAAMDKVSVSRAVRVLVERGLISRTRNEADRRSASLRLTADGQTVYDDVAPVALAAEEELLEGMSEADVEAFLRVLDRLRERAQRMLDR